MCRRRVNAQFLFSLKNNKEIKVTLVGIDSNSEATGKYFCDKFYQVPKGRNNEYIRKLKKNSYRREDFTDYSCSDEEALKISKHYEFLKVIKLKLLVQILETLKILIIKKKLMFFRKKDIN